MPKMVPTVGTRVVRDGKRVRPEIGKAFNYTADEIKTINAIRPNALRKPSNEDDGSTDGISSPAATTTPSSAEKSQSKAKGGTKPATASKSDEEVEAEDEL